MAKRKGEDFSEVIAARDAHRTARMNFDVAKLREQAANEESIQALLRLHSTGKHLIEVLDKHGLKAVVE